MPLLKGQRTGKLSHKQLQALAEGRKTKYDEPKDQRFSAVLTKTGKNGLVAIANELGMKPVELLEAIGRGDYQVVPSDSIK